MSYDIRWDDEAVKQLRKLHASIAQRIVKKIKEMQEDPFQVDVKKLKGEELYRLRVGDYRVLFSLHQETIEIVEIGHRRNIYKE